MITAAMVARLEDLKTQPKFRDEPGTIYNGMRPENDRQLAEAQLNDLIEQLIRGLPDDPTKAFVLARFAQTLDCFPGYDTEDRERLCTYLEEIMDIVGIESSDGLLNRWMYGFDPNDIAVSRP